MAHFAIINDKSIVIQVIVVSNNDILDENGNENEQIGIQFVQNLLGNDIANCTIKQTSYNARFRKNYAGIGMIYFPDIDAFLSPIPYPSWQLNTILKEWEAPIPYPTDGNNYIWNEQNQSWDHDS